ncbi:Transcription factor, MADS-box [Dillenia turbinata]|uniref:Transcription factor, MADS-box n=1 Tax=Dillenia turbinata TaxID=194707 RepID=A0AAN8VCA7_9MAGN
MAPRKLKIEAKKMSKASSNRLHCLIRKGSELTTLCDIEGCIVVFDDDRLITAESWSKQNDVHQILKKYHQFVEEQRRKELKKVGVKSKKVNKSTGRHCDDMPSSNGCVSDASQPHFGFVSNVNADASVVLEDMEMHMGIDNMAGQLEDADIFESLPDNGALVDHGALVDMEKQLESLISSEYVDPLPEMGFKDTVGQFEEDTLDYLLSNFDFDGIVGQSAMEISSDHRILPEFASDYSHVECKNEKEKIPEEKLKAISQMHEKQEDKEMNKKLITPHAETPKTRNVTTEWRDGRVDKATDATTLIG